MVGVGIPARGPTAHARIVQCNYLHSLYIFLMVSVTKRFPCLLSITGFRVMNQIMWVLGAMVRLRSKIATQRPSPPEYSI